MADANQSTPPPIATAGGNGRRINGIVRWSVRAKAVTAILALLVTSASAYVLFEDYMPALKFQVKHIVDERNSRQTVEIRESVTRSLAPLQAIAPAVDNLLRQSIIDRCERAKEARMRLDSRQFDLERVSAAAVASEVKTEIERRIRATRIELDIATERARSAREEMQRAVGYSC